VTQFNGEDGWTLLMPARYVIAQDGTIAYAEVNAITPGAPSHRPSSRFWSNWGVGGSPDFFRQSAPIGSSALPSAEDQA
jgi:hypothetical protein